MSAALNKCYTCLCLITLLYGSKKYICEEFFFDNFQFIRVDIFRLYGKIFSASYNSANQRDRRDRNFSNPGIINS